MSLANSFIRFLITVLLVLAPTWTRAESFSVPNSGSPYTDLAQSPMGTIVHLPTGLSVSFEGMIETVSGSSVIYIGETHDSLEDHRVQLEVLQALQNRYPGKVAVGMEMFRRSAQDSINRWLAGSLTNRAFKKLFYDHWGGDYQLYENILAFIRKNGLPLIALKSTVEAQDLLKHSDKPPAGALPELDDTDVYHKAQSRSIFGGHTKHGIQQGSPYRTLLLWEETMAETVANFLKDESHRNWKLVVLAGGFHVQYGFGIPKRTFRRVSHPYSIILPTITEIPEDLSNRQMDTEPVSIPLYAGDFAWKVKYKVLPEKRIKLGVILEELDLGGVRVRSVSVNSNAGRAGISQGDVLLSFDEQTITGVENLVDQLQKKSFGDRGILQILRHGQEIDLEVEFKE